MLIKFTEKLYINPEKVVSIIFFEDHGAVVISMDNGEEYDSPFSIEKTAKKLGYGGKPPRKPSY